MPSQSFTSHYVATAAEVVLWVLLLRHQGVVETKPRVRVRWDVLRRRVGSRLRRWPVAGAARYAAVVGLAGTLALATVGYTFEFMHGPHWHVGWQRTVMTIVITFVAPSFIVRRCSWLPCYLCMRLAACVIVIDDAWVAGAGRVAVPRAIAEATGRGRNRHCCCCC
jgi:hypothetical protein